LLLDYESLFDGTLGDWNRPPVSIELKEGATPYHGRPYPIPQIHKATLIKEINRLVDIGVMKRQSSSQWASPISSEATQGKASAVADKRLPNH
jgi:hypothetical protein